MTTNCHRSTDGTCSGVWTGPCSPSWGTPATEGTSATALPFVALTAVGPLFRVSSLDFWTLQFPPLHSRLPELGVFDMGIPKDIVLHGQGCQNFNWLFFVLTLRLIFIVQLLDLVRSWTVANSPRPQTIAPFPYGALEELPRQAVFSLDPRQSQVTQPQRRHLSRRGSLLSWNCPCILGLGACRRLDHSSLEHLLLLCRDTLGARRYICCNSDAIMCLWRAIAEPKDLTVASRSR